MSLFLLTDNETKAKKANGIWSEIFQNNELITLSGNYNIVISNNFKNKSIYLRETNKSFILGFGTWFSKSGFFDKAISVNEIEEFSYTTSRDIYGHYCFIIFDKKIQEVRIITDPVGLINIYGSEDKNGIYVSNDCKIIADIYEDISFSKYGMQEFLLKENTIGSETIFNEIKRLKIGHEFLIKQNRITEKELYNYSPKRISKEEYLNKILEYFKAINLYPGQVATDLSAGYDTRVVAACAVNNIDNLIAITNDNTADRGVDLVTSSVIAGKLGLPLKKIVRDKDIELETNVMLHSFSLGRNIIRSKAMPITNERKYNYTDLLIGGYGGEILRAKYSKYKSLDDFIENYYDGKLLVKWDQNNTYNYIKKSLSEEYMQDWISTPGQFSNWLYAMDRMRIWGGSAVLGKMIYGDRLHPFMDWQLVEPLFKMDPDDLYDAKLLKHIIAEFAGELSQIPINAPHPLFLKDQKLLFERIQKIYWKGINFGNRLKLHIGLYSSSKREEFLDKYIKPEMFSNTNKKTLVDGKIIEKIRNPEILTRYAMIKILYENLKKS